MTLTKYNAAGERLTSPSGFAPQGVVCQVARSANIATPITPIPFDVKRFDPFNYWDTTNNRFQPKVPGYYEVSLIIDATVGSWYQCRKNGVFYNYFGFSSAAASEWIQESGILVYLNGTTDYVDMVATGTGTLYGGGNSGTMFQAQLVAASVGVAPEPWHYVGAAGEPAFGAGWSNHVNAVKFMKDPHGFVHCGGRIQSSGSQRTAWTFPPGYRPGDVAGGPLAGYWASTRQLANWQLSGTDGALNIYGGNDAVTAMQYTQLDTIIFRAEL
jgi:hypothetical protein